MALTTPRIIGNQLTVTADGVKTKWRDFSITFNEVADNASAADSTEDEEVNKRKFITGKCTGFLGSVNNGGTLPQIGDAISDLAVAVGSDTVIPSLSGYTNIKVVAPINYNFVDGPATFEFNFRSGRLN